MASCNNKVELLDVETNKMYTLYLSAEDAHKARNDLNFASTLLKYAKENISNSDAPSTSAVRMSSASDTSDVSDVSDVRSNNEDTYIWNNKETLLLIHLYKEHEEIFTSGKMKQHLCWERIAKEMANKGYNIPGKKCNTKFQTLKRTYKQIKDHNNKSGNSRKTWEYFEAMDELCGQKPWIEPVSTASSDQNAQSASSTELGLVKRNKGKLHSTKETLLEFKKLRAEKRDAQHKEKMDLLRDIKNLIQETLQDE